MSQTHIFNDDSNIMQRIYTSMLLCAIAGAGHVPGVLVANNPDEVYLQGLNLDKNI